ncbi:hypothetical protein [Bradyrhizobium sp. WSM3983]|uniref:hypothetical protein n=1 Tax=Bradyrhizobium sp. WSM3983 TaxID=1038867 RepID=UPI000401311F|nr:hypothetical protein [Bradyrhizobium sp. WSM3983]
MAGLYAFAVEGLSTLSSLDDLPAKIEQAARRAVNAATDRARAAAVRGVRQQVNFPASYFTGDDSRLRVSKRPSTGDLEGVVTGRQRPTSLARFTTSGSVGTRGGVTVEVKSGSARFMRRAFLIRLRAGNADLDTKSNLGLAVRLKPGESLSNKRNMIRMSNGLYLLYGPSVDQVFRTVASDISPEIADFLEAEFLRLVGLDL